MPQLPAGHAGKRGVLDNVYRLRESVTCQVAAFAQPPLYTHSALYLDDHLPGMAFVYLMSGSEGLLQGDRIALRLRVEAGAQVHVTNTSATKIHGMQHDYAAQRIALDVGPDAFVEWLPEPLIPHPGARLWQEADLNVDPSATLIFSDVLVAGRLARDERFEFQVIGSATTARSGGHILVRDRFVIEPARQRLRGPGAFGEYDVLGTLYVITRQTPAAELAEALHARVAAAPEVLAGASTLPDGAGVIVRALGARTDRVQQVLNAAWAEARQCLTGTPLPDMRKY